MTCAKKICLAFILAVALAVAFCVTVTFGQGVLWAATPAKGVTIGAQTPYYIRGNEVTHGTELELGYLNDFKGWFGGPIIHLGHGDVVEGNSAHVAYGIGLETFLLLNDHFMVVAQGRLMHMPVVQGAGDCWGWGAGGGLGGKFGGFYIKAYYEYAKPFDGDMDPAPPKNRLLFGAGFRF